MSISITRIISISHCSNPHIITGAGWSASRHQPVAKQYFLTKNWLITQSGGNWNMVHRLKVTHRTYVMKMKLPTDTELPPFSISEVLSSHFAGPATKLATCRWSMQKKCVFMCFHMRKQNDCSALHQNYGRVLAFWSPTSNPGAKALCKGESHGLCSVSQTWSNSGNSSCTAVHKQESWAAL